MFRWRRTRSPYRPFRRPIWCRWESAPQRRCGGPGGDAARYRAVFTTDGAVVEAAVTLLVVGAALQLFDGLQTCAMGALRGAGDTHTAMLCHLIAYWVVGLPAGYVLCFNFRLGAAGMWSGLCAAVILLGMALLWVWWRRAKSMREAASYASNDAAISLRLPTVD